jgi:hypothetical protein
MPGRGQEDEKNMSGEKSYFIAREMNGGACVLINWWRTRQEDNSSNDANGGGSQSALESNPAGIVVILFLRAIICSIYVQELEAVHESRAVL